MDKIESNGLEFPCFIVPFIKKTMYGCQKKERKTILVISEINDCTGCYNSILPVVVQMYTSISHTIKSPQTSPNLYKETPQTTYIPL